LPKGHDDRHADPPVSARPRVQRSPALVAVMDNSGTAGFISRATSGLECAAGRRQLLLHEDTKQKLQAGCRCRRLTFRTSRRLPAEDRQAGSARALDCRGRRQAGRRALRRRLVSRSGPDNVDGQGVHRHGASWAAFTRGARHPETVKAIYDHYRRFVRRRPAARATGSILSLAVASTRWPAFCRHTPTGSRDPHGPPWHSAQLRSRRPALEPDWSPIVRRAISPTRRKPAAAGRGRCPRAPEGFSRSACAPPRASRHPTTRLRPSGFRAWNFAGGREGVRAGWRDGAD
jgi:hypothetical protein